VLIVKHFYSVTIGYIVEGIRHLATQCHEKKEIKKYQIIGQCREQICQRYMQREEEARSRVSSVAEEGYKKNVGDNRNTTLFGSAQQEQKATQDTEDQKSNCYTTS